MIQTAKYYPRSLFMQSIVEYYQLIEISTPIVVNTLPNGRVDAWINIDGGFGFVDKETGVFSPASNHGFFPLTNDISVIEVKEKLLCLNIKFLPHLLAFPSIKKLQTSKQSVSFEELFGKTFVWKRAKTKTAIEELIVKAEIWFTKMLYNDMVESVWLQSMITKMEMDADSPVTVKRLAKEANMTVKTFERKFLALMGINPKIFCRIIRFQKAVRKIQAAANNHKGSKLTLSLADGYYDQSHFIKDSKDISGEAPRKLLKKMQGDISDVIVKSV